MSISQPAPGKTEERCKRIFEPYFSPGKPIEAPAGRLSITLCVITQKHGETIDADSIPGEGTAFIIRSPLHMR